jgi:hypothetical protein
MTKLVNRILEKALSEWETEELPVMPVKGQGSALEQGKARRNVRTLILVRAEGESA